MAVIDPTYQMGQRLPYQIEVLAAVVDVHGATVGDNKFERIKSGLLSKWSIGILVLIFVVVAAIMGFVALLWEFYGFST